MKFWEHPLFVSVPGAIAFVVLALVSQLRPTGINNYVWLADAWLHGHLWIGHAGDYIDYVSYKGHPYIIEAPLPALAMLPMVALYGMDANQTVVGIVAAAVGISALWRLCQQNRLSLRDAVLVTLFFLFGTSYFVCAVLGDVWFIAHVFAAMFTLLALTEVFGKKRVALVVLLGVCAAFSRFSLVPAIPFYIAYCSGRNWRAALSSLWVLVPALAVWVWYNEARWGEWSDIGYSYFYYFKDQGRSPGVPPFSLVHVPMQLRAFFLEGLTLRSNFPWLLASGFGTAISITSPALVVALIAPLKDRKTVLLWLLAAATAVPSLLYYVTGYVQFGMRHALDFEPFLVALMIVAAKTRPFPMWSWPLFAWSILFGMYGGAVFIFDRAVTL